MSERGRDGGCCLPGFFGCCLGFVLLIACIGGVPFGLTYYYASGSPDPLDENFTPSEQGAQAYEAAFTQALNREPGTQFSLSFTDEDFASWLNLTYQDQFASEAELESYADDLEFQAEFEDGQVKVYASLMLIEAIDLDLGALGVVELALPDEDTPANQKIDIEVVEFQIGRATATEGLEEDLTNAIYNAITEELDNISEIQETNYEITGVQIQDGRLTIVGQITAIDAVSQ